MSIRHQPLRRAAPHRREAARALVRAFSPVIKQRITNAGPHVFRTTITNLGGYPGWRTWNGVLHHYPNINVGDFNVTLGQTVVWYDQRAGLANGDTLVLVEIATDDFTAIEVESNLNPASWTDDQVAALLSEPPEED